MAKRPNKKKPDIKRRGGGYAPKTPMSDLMSNTLSGVLSNAKEDDIFEQARAANEGQQKVSKRFNHRTTDFGVWVDYNGYRFKDAYSLRLLDGTVIPFARPNGSGWYLFTAPAVTREEYDKLIAAGTTYEQIPRTVIPETPLYDPLKGRIDDKDVAQVALVPDEDLPFDSWDFKGIDRVVRNRRMFAGCLSPDEDLSVGFPKSAKAKKISIGMEYKKGNTTTWEYAEYRKPGVFGGLNEGKNEFVRDQALFTFDKETDVILAAEYFTAGDVPNAIRKFFQQGGVAKLTLPVNVTVTDGDRYGECTAIPLRAEIIKAPRSSQLNWLEFFESTPIFMRVHFTFYYEDRPVEEPIAEE